MIVSENRPFCVCQERFSSNTCCQIRFMSILKKPCTLLSIGRKIYHCSFLNRIIVQFKDNTQIVPCGYLYILFTGFCWIFIFKYYGGKETKFSKYHNHRYLLENPTFLAEANQTKPKNCLFDRCGALLPPWVLLI